MTPSAISNLSYALLKGRLLPDWLRGETHQAALNSHLGVSPSTPCATADLNNPPIKSGEL